MNIGIAHVRGALLCFLRGKSALLYLCQMLPSISKIIPESPILANSDFPYFLIKCCLYHSKSIFQKKIFSATGTRNMAG